MVHASKGWARVGTLLLSLGFTTFLAADTQHPLAPPDFSSPRATLNTFLTTGDHALSFVSGDHWNNPSRESSDRLKALMVDMLISRRQRAGRGTARPAGTTGRGAHTPRACLRGLRHDPNNPHDAGTWSISGATDAGTGAVPGRVMKRRSSSLTAPTTGTPGATMRVVIACMTMTLSIIW